MIGGDRSTRCRVMNYYDALSEELARRYERLEFEKVHSGVRDEFPALDSNVLDVGAGSGRDAAALARKGHRVTAVEPSEGMRREGRARHGGAQIHWLDDRLPRLEKVYEQNESFDLILLSAVWMHVQPDERDLAMQRLRGLLAPGGKIVISTRSVQFSGNRTMYAVDPERLRRRAEDHELAVDLEKTSEDMLGREEVSWSTLVLRRPDEGLSALPTLRNIIVNDNKSSTYKLALLRTLARIAAASPGLVVRRDDGYCDVPLGLVALYWLKSYWELVTDGIPQQAHGGQTSKFRSELLEADEKISNYDLRIGNQFSGRTAQLLHAALRVVRDTVRDGPAKYTTHVGSDDPIFKYDGRGFGASGVSSSVSALELRPEYLESYGALRVPTSIYEALERHWVWIEPTVLNEWVSLMRRYESTDDRSYEAYRDALLWRDVDERETREVAEIVDGFLQTGNPAAVGIWTGRSLTESTPIEIDHCIPYSLWYNNSLWNLFPSTSTANQSKRDRVPAQELLDASKARIHHWWGEAFLDSERTRRFAMEADAALPGTDLDPDQPDLDDIFEALMWQVDRMRRDQQVDTWSGP